MVIKNKIWMSIGLGVGLTIIYYYIYAYFQIWFDNLCKKNYCIEFFPIGDFIACYIAIVGLYFVVTSLDAWKHQDQYQTAKKNIEQLYTISNTVGRLTNILRNLDEYTLKNPNIFQLSNAQPPIKHTNAFLKFQSFKTEYEIDELIEHAEESILEKSINLKHKKFENLINKIKNYTQNIEKEIQLLDEAVMIQYQKDLLTMQTTLQDIEDKINKMEDGPLKEGNQTQLKFISSESNLNIFPKEKPFIFEDDSKIQYKKAICGDIEQSKITEVLNKEKQLLLDFEIGLKDLQSILNDSIS